MSSRRSSESATSVDSEVILEAERLELERLALKELDAAASKPVAFSVRTNISFDAAVYCPDAPSPNHVVGFEAREFLHIKKRFNPHWWIGRRVRIGSPLGFIPSPAKLEAIHSNAAHLSGLSQPFFGPGTIPGELPNGPGSPMTAPNHGNKSAGTGAIGDSGLERNRTRGLFVNPPEITLQTISSEGTHRDQLLHGRSSDRRGHLLTVSRRRQSESSPPPDALDDDMEEYRDSAPHNHLNAEKELTTNAVSKKVPFQQTQVPGTGPGVKRKVFSRKPDFVAPYEIVPCMRPVVFVGPALKGYEVTDMMQKAIFDAMKKHFDGRIIVSRVSTNLSMAKRVGDLLHLDKKNVMERGRTRQLVSLLEVQQDLERIFHLASKMQLLLLDCDTVNHPSQVSKTCLAPIVIYIKINSIRVLNRLIKNRGKAQKKYAGVQTAAAEKLLQCPSEAFEFVVDQNTLGAATDALCHFLEGYWNATHPPSVLSKAERLLGVESNEPDSDRPLVPMTPGHPGLSVVTKSALDAGFTSQEIIALTGARAAGWRAENGTHADHELGLTGPHYGGGSVSSDFNAVNVTGQGHTHDMDGEHYAYDQTDSGPAEGDDEDGPLHLDGSVGHHGNTMSHKPRLHMGAAQAAAMAALAAGLTPKPRIVHPALAQSDKFPFHSHADENGHRTQPGLAMGIGMGLASGVAATINAALFQGTGGGGGGHKDGSVGKPSGPSSTVTAAVAASMRPRPLKDLGIHQVESSDGTHVYQSRSARQAKQREEELERVRREAEAKALAIQATVGGRRRRRVRDRRPHDPANGDNGTDWHNGALEYGSSLERDRVHGMRLDSSPPGGPVNRRYEMADEYSDTGDRYTGAGIQDDSTPVRRLPITNMVRACPPDD
ncbi:High voltage-activated calcium channel beta subunit CavB [Fasciola hepatica]|uniref:High voltage-activated calcium channel beta subunit CavB n=1 Tax=Fasciola hepatica TaxID=6192 RepID=A0A4E0RDX2_FASHE|nr:High voltage-activated calcium channel beta subunit CavB [Fasciola hepatica]